MPKTCTDNIYPPNEIQKQTNITNISRRTLFVKVRKIINVKNVMDLNLESSCRTFSKLEKNKKVTSKHKFTMYSKPLITRSTTVHSC